MALQTRKYIRKPLIVEAVEVTTENFVEVALWCQGSITNNDGSEPEGPVNPGGQHIRVRVHNPKGPRQTKAYPGDWILYTDRGYKIYTPKAFELSFELLTDEEKARLKTQGVPA